MLEFTEAGGTTFDLERIYLELAAGDFLAVRLGRDHLMLGRYMQAYHHALLFQLATARPRLLSFEDEGGPIPAHQVGAEALGDIHLSDTTDLHYAVRVGNGRGRFSDDVLNSGDRNLFKSLLAHLSLRPGALDVGISGYWDRIPAGYTSEAGELLIKQDIVELIGAVHAAYLEYPFDLQGEGYVVSHRSVGSSTSTKLLGGFVQLGYSFDRFTPYLRFEAVRRDREDVFFDASGVPNRIRELRAGMRMSLSERVVLKLEYVGDLKNEVHGGVAQAAFGL